MESTNTLANARQDSREFIARQTSTSATQILAKTEVCALTCQTHLDASARQVTTEFDVRAMSMSAHLTLASTEPVKMASTSSFAIAHQAMAVNAARLKSTSVAPTLVSMAVSATIT